MFVCNPQGRGIMRLLLTSAGIKNASIHNALVELLGKPIAEASALIIPTAIYPFPGGAGMAWRAICGAANGPLGGLGWKSLGVLELTALPSIADDAWIPTVQETDALLVWGGDPLYLEQLAKSRDRRRHGKCRVAGHASVFDRSQGTFGARGGERSAHASSRAPF